MGYYRYDKLGDRDFYTLKIKCDKMSVTIPSDRIPDSFSRRELFFGDLEKTYQVKLRTKETGSKRLNGGSASALDSSSSTKSSKSKSAKSSKKAKKAAKSAKKAERKAK